MANPLFEALTGRGQAPLVPNNPMPAAQPNMMDAINQLRTNPVQMIRNAGYNVPDEIANNPQATVMHLLQSGQIGGPLMQRIQPMLNGLLKR